MIVGTVVFAAVRPTTRPMCPASRDSSCLSAEPTRSISGGGRLRRHDVVAVGPHGQERHA